MRAVTLNALRAGIERRREKGAQPDALFDLVNGLVQPDGAVTSRPGTRGIVRLPAGTKGLCADKGQLVVFAHTPVTVPASTPTVRVELVRHPGDPTLALTHIHFAAPFLGHLYVVAEFAGGDVFHYWLRTAQAWNGSETYDLGELVQPLTPNGFLYRAHRLRAPGPAWAPKVPRAVGARIEPTVFNGYEYECIQTIGTNPRSGDVEPTWPTQPGAIVVEDTSRATTAPPSTGTVTPPVNVVDEGTADRYSGGVGSIRDKTGIGTRTYQL